MIPVAFTLRRERRGLSKRAAGRLAGVRGNDVVAYERGELLFSEKGSKLFLDALNKTWTLEDNI